MIMIIIIIMIIIPKPGYVNHQTDRWWRGRADSRCFRRGISK